MTNNAPKKMNKQSISRWIALIAEKIELVLHGLYELIRYLLRFFVSFFRYLILLAQLPETVIGFCILFFGISVVISVWQWFMIGEWVGTLFGVSAVNTGLTYMTTGILGVLVGLGINSFQLGSELWKISKSIGKVYAQEKINTEFAEDVTSSNVATQEKSISHRELKKMRRASYLFEYFVTTAFILATGLTTWKVVQAAISLRLPEFFLAKTKAVIDTLGYASDKAAEKAAEKQGVF
jgi:hypothetical protein